MCFQEGGRWQLSRQGCFSSSIKTLSYNNDAGFLAKLARIKDASPISVRITLMPGSASPPVRKVFDYASLDAGTSQFVREQTGEIRVLMKRTAQGIVEIGQKLIEVKGRLAHGRFGDWIEAEFGWSWDTAGRFINVATRFSDVPQLAEFAPSALYILAAPSTPAPARAEALARAKAGETITYTAAKVLKQKYSAPPIKPKLEKETEPKLEKASQTQPTATSALPAQSGSTLEIVALRHQNSASTLESATNVMATHAAPTFLVPQPSQPVSAPDVPGVWWRLGGRHLLYCGDPNSSVFLARIAEEKVSLMLAFPSTPNWQPTIRSRTYFLMENLLERKDVRLFEDTLESLVLLCSKVGQLVVSCFLPTPGILSVINRQDRRGLFAEPDPRRVNAVILDWKKAGLKAERITNVN